MSECYIINKELVSNDEKDHVMCHKFIYIATLGSSQMTENLSQERVTWFGLGSEVYHVTVIQLPRIFLSSSGRSRSQYFD